ncbi:hypothetical protein GGR95_000243 [Sulfitobacter undariae]|uniref:Uncharacterized protein n=1 Tax=Sulfitobacter undariae TaxID=1563671 RepID=A0A7W6E7E4_9RHOB|nr:hypothetical protein [Sulfitobacter undariae]MBB3992624.1 hypothetical protein [Sulfitobacter undariae]
MFKIYWSAVFRGQETLPVRAFGVGSDNTSKELSGVGCTLDGQSGSTTVTAFNATTQQRMNGAAGGGILGVIVVGAITAANVDNEKDEFKYPPVTVQMKKK